MATPRTWPLAASDRSCAGGSIGRAIPSARLGNGSERTASGQRPVSIPASTSVRAQELPLMPLWGWIVLGAIALLVVFLIFTYNALVRLRNMVDEAWNQISVQLKRRHDLIPNLVNAVKGYMDFEQETLTRVIEARSAAVTATERGPGNAQQAAQAENFLTGALRQLFALVENYPDLKANE